MTFRILTDWEIQGAKAQQKRERAQKDGKVAKSQLKVVSPTNRVPLDVFCC